MLSVISQTVARDENNQAEACKDFYPIQWSLRHALERYQQEQLIKKQLSHE
jgi:hypothetical protein